MSRRRRNPPVIVVGMHRSGTSMLSRLLQDLGVFMGRDLTGNAESRIFQDLNRSVVKASGGDWVHVDSVFEKTGEREFVEQEVNRLATILFNRGALRRFLGVRRFLMRALGLGAPWGWKDPRNTLTIPVWLGIFPDLKVIHIVRSGVDAAISLHRREVRRSEDDQDFQSACLDFGECFAVWQRYERAWLRNRELVALDRRQEVRYEAILLDPVSELARIADFVGYRGNPSRVVEVAAAVNRDRLNNKALREDYAREIVLLPSNPRMKELGYEDVG